ncbi:hypothetical protein JCM16814_07190 [Desulfobaculum senezii]|jgi:hypothetical protein
MMLPQDEARTKYCPHLKAEDGKIPLCQGVQCMMWRFRYADKNGEHDEGYCGLAGKPAGAR